MPKIFVATPCHGGSVCAPTVTSFLKAKDECAQQGWQLDIHLRVGDADIARARNVLLAQFLKTDCSDLFYIDSDISWTDGSFTKMILIDRDFVAAAYRVRTDETEFYPVHWPDERRLEMDKVTGAPLLLAERVPGGFMRLRRKAVEKMVKNYQGRWYLDNRLPDVECPLLFEFTHDPKERRSEDFEFCDRWRAIGGEIWVQPDIVLGHTGPCTFVGSVTQRIEKEMQQRQLHSIMGA